MNTTETNTRQRFFGLFSMFTKKPLVSTEREINLKRDRDFLFSEYKSDAINIITLHADLLRRVKNLENDKQII